MASGTLTFGLPRIHREAGERRDFLPDLVGTIAALDVPVVVESGVGSGMGLTHADYSGRSPNVFVGTSADAFGQDVVLVLRSPDPEFELMRPGATLISMLHYSTRPLRVRRLHELGLEAISLDSLTDELGNRLVANAHDVAWNGVEAAFDLLEQTYPQLARPGRPPVRVTIMGAGEIGRHAVEASTKYGDRSRAERLAGSGGVEVTTLGRDLTGDERYLSQRLRVTDVLVDATQRSDPSRPLISNDLVGCLPEHAVICDLVVDPYLLHEDPPTVRGIEGIPQGNLDGFTFGVDASAWDDIPPEIPSANRRAVASCYSWPGVHPRRCMELYGAQLAPLLVTLFERGSVEGLGSGGGDRERALLRASLSGWLREHSPAGPALIA